MSKLLTTGQMIDQLKVGEIAEGENGYYKGFKVEKTHYSEIVPCEKGINNFLVMNTHAAVTKWRIFPKYVTFEEAVEAMRNEKKVRIHINSRKSMEINIFNSFTGMELGEYGFYTFLNSKWSIED